MWSFMEPGIAFWKTTETQAAIELVTTGSYNHIYPNFAPASFATYSSQRCHLDLPHLCFSIFFFNNLLRSITAIHMYTGEGLLPMATPPKQSDSSSPDSYQLPIAAQLQVEPLEILSHFSWDSGWLTLKRNHSSCALKRAAAHVTCRRRHSFASSGSCALSTLSSSMFSESWWGQLRAVIKTSHLGLNTCSPSCTDCVCLRWKGNFSD